MQFLTRHTVRDRVFRSRVLKAYDRRCAFTGFQFINGGGRAEVEAAHIKSVEAKGPDVVQNGLAVPAVPLSPLARSASRPLPQRGEG